TKLQNMSNSYNPTHMLSASNTAPSTTRYPGATAPKSFDTYTDFATYISQRQCPTCHVPFLSRSSHIAALFQPWATLQAPLTPRVTCRSCSKATCIACLDKESSRRVSHDVQGTNVSWCCGRGRLFVVWILVCGFDARYCAARGRDRVAGLKNGATAAGGYGGGGRFGRAAQRDNGTGYEDGEVRAESVERRMDRFDALCFGALAKLLPSPEGTASFDGNPPGAVVSVLVNSKVLDKAAELLRNDSLDNASKRKDLYMALVGFLRVIGTHEATKAKAMYNDRVVWPDSVNILTLSFMGPGQNRSQAGSSLASGLRNLNAQSEIMLKQATKMRSEFSDQDGTDLLWLCRMISDLSTHLRIGSDRSLTTHGIVEVSDNQIWSTHAHAGLARNAMQSRPGRMKRLITEVTNLRTGLAEGIFVKHAESRLDLMKILIVGPKVCLSLLGTWPGPNWNQNQSTILQVLISIQAMIFCENPVHNEPGNSTIATDQDSRQLNAIVRALTAKFAICRWATNPPALWSEEVSHHFKRNGNTILQQVERWARDSQD
ncbi:hypothetical protein BDU57DRAFT_417537, partial [Ampelomyces quisqualis]